MASELENIQALLNIYVLETNRLYGYKLLNSDRLPKRNQHLLVMQKQCAQDRLNLLQAIAEFGQTGDYLQTAFLEDASAELDLSANDD